MNTLGSRAEAVVIVFANQKGGCGKTTLAVHCAGLWAQRGEAVRFYDLDLQQSASTYSEGLPLIAFHSHQLPSRKAGGISVIDTPPTLGKELASALLIADVVIVPIHEYSALQGVKQLHESVSAARKRNPRLQVFYALTQMDSRSGHCREVEAATRAAFGLNVFTQIISRSYAWADATRDRQLITALQPNHKCSVQIRHLAEEILYATQRTPHSRTDRGTVSQPRGAKGKR